MRPDEDEVYGDVDLTTLEDEVYDDSPSEDEVYGAGEPARDNLRKTRQRRRRVFLSGGQQ